MINDFVEGFLEESEDLFASAESLCLKAEENGSLGDEDMNALFRDVHTMKGSGAAVDLKSFPRYVHDVETFMDKLRKKELAYQPEMADALINSLDVMKVILEQESREGEYEEGEFLELTVDTLNVIRGFMGMDMLEKKVTAEKKDEENKKEKITPQKKSSSTIRVSLDKVDYLMNNVGDLVITNAMLSELQTEIAEKNLSNKFSEKLQLLEREIRSIQDAVMNIRMVPMETIYSKFPKMIRDVSKKLGKDINYTHTGDSVEIDKATIEGLTDPLMHIIRNSLDHGIESAEKRIEAGKSPEGNLAIGAETTNGQIIITIKDDGGGINAQKVSEKALSSGIITEEELSNMSHKEKAMLIFAAGLSTAEAVSEVSGRGVGMDVVRTNIEGLGGKIDVETEEGVGTIMRITLPLTLAILDGLNIKIGDEIYVVPLGTVAETLQPEEGMIKYVGDGKTEFLQIRDDFLPIVKLYEKLDVRGEPITDFKKGIFLILNQGSQKIAIFADEFQNQQQFVVKPLDKNFLNIPGFSGATIKGNGSISLILDAFAFTTNNQMKGFENG